MTSPGASGASRMRIAGFALLALAAVAAVVGLISLGGQGSSSTASPPPVASTGPMPNGAPGQAPAGQTPPGAPVPAGPPEAGAPIVPGPQGGLAPAGPGADSTAAGVVAAPGSGGDGSAAGGGSGGGAGGAAGGGAGGSGGGAGGAGGGAGSGGGPVASGVTFRVLNNSMIRGLAERAAGELRGHGFVVSEVGNYPAGIIPTSTAFYTPGTPEQGAAQALASQFGIRAEPRFPGIAHASPGVIVIVTNDWGAGKS